MAISRGKNRRKADATQRRAAAKDAVSTHGPWLLKLTVLAAATAAVFFGGQASYEWARTTPYFALKRVVFQGLKHTTESELLKLAGVGPGQNLMALDVQALEAAMASHPWVKRVELSRHFPNGITVKVSEHAPEAIVALGDLYLLDGDGEPFKRLQAGDALDLPLVSGIDREMYVSEPETVKAQLRDALAVMRDYAKSEAGKGAQLSEVRVEGEEVALILSGTGQEVRLGDGDVQQKLERLARIKGELEKRGLVAEVIHLDNRLRAGWVTVKVSAPVSERKSGAQ